jgi:transcriptional regulator with XRE-family HTH domain
MSPVKRPRQTLADTIQRYRLMSGFSQHQLSDLSFKLAEQGIIDSGIHRTQITRIEGGQKPQPATLFTLSRVLAAALSEAGYDMTGDDVYHHLMNTDRLKLTTRHVSPRAAEIDAILAPLKLENAEPIWDALVAAASAYIDGLRRVKRAIRARRADGDR